MTIHVGPRRDVTSVTRIIILPPEKYVPWDLICKTRWNISSTDEIFCHPTCRFNFFLKLHAGWHNLSIGWCMGDAVVANLVTDCAFCRWQNKTLGYTCHIGGRRALSYFGINHQGLQFEVKCFIHVECVNFSLDAESSSFQRIRFIENIRWGKPQKK